jgi:hypothetical protein
MAFNENAFIIAGTAIAIGGVGLYLWDTRGSAAMSSLSSSTQQYTPQIAGKTKRKFHKKINRKTKRH